MFAKLMIKIRGERLIQHNKRLANYRDPYCRQLKLLSAKRKKTDEELEEISRIEFFGGLYMNKDGPCVPAECIQATIKEGAKMQKLGKQTDKALRVIEDMSLEYDGPRTAEELWELEDFVYITDVRVGASRVQRTRPIFPKWEGTIVLVYDMAMLNESQVLKAIADAGKYVGLLERRPFFGTFEVVEHTSATTE